MNLLTNPIGFCECLPSPALTSSHGCCSLSVLFWVAMPLGLNSFRSKQLRLGPPSYPTHYSRRGSETACMKPPNPCIRLFLLPPCSHAALCSSLNVALPS